MIEVISLARQPLWVHALVFMASAFVIWSAGTRLERHADVLSRRTGLGEAFTGVLLLATATSLPEIATTLSAVLAFDNPTLAIHNLLGGVAMQTAILVGADGLSRRRGALTYFTPRVALLIQGVGLILILQLAIAGVAANGVPSVASVSAWGVLILATHVGITYVTYRQRGQPRWTATRADDVPAGQAEAIPEATPEGEGAGGPSTRAVAVRFGLLCVAIAIGGWFATATADRLAEVTGLGDAFLGATLLALATSLPEVSTTIAASREGRYTTAVSNIFGSNAFDVSLVLLADALYRGGSVFEEAGNTVLLVAAIGSILTALYLIGLLERENKTVLGVGWDSAAVVVVYVCGMAVLYHVQ